MEGSLYSSLVFLWLLSLLVANVHAQVGGTSSTAVMATQPVGAPEESADSSEGIVNATLANVTSMTTLSQDNEEGSVATTSSITSTLAISTSTITPTQSEAKTDIEEDVNVLHNTTSVSDVLVTRTTPTTIIPTTSLSSIAPTSPALSTVAPIPIPQVTTTSPPEIVPTTISPTTITTTAEMLPTQPAVLSSPTTPISVPMTTSSSTVIEPTRDGENNEVIEYENEMDVNDTTLLNSNSTIQPQEDEVTASSSDFELESVTDIYDETEVTSTSITITTDDRSTIDSLVQAACEKERKIDTVVVLGVVVIVNVVSVVVTALCVYRVVKRHLSWDPPPLAFPKGGRGDGPLDNCSGLDLASDVDCKSGESGGTNIPIIITNEDGWCVPYTENEVKKTKNKIEDTGV